MSCEQRDRYLYGDLPSSEEAGFLEHASACPECAAELAEWDAVVGAIRSWSDAAEAAEAPSEVPEALMEAAQALGSSKARSPSVARWAALSGLALAAAALIAVVATAPGPEAPSTPPEIASAPPIEAPSPPDVEPPVISAFTDLGALAPGATIEAPADSNGVLWIGADALVLGASGQVTLERGGSEVSLSLDRGTVAVDVVPRGGAGSFQLSAGEDEVRVVGTRFSVSRADDAPLEVEVVEGRVEVSSAGADWTLDAGQRLIAIPGASPAPSASLGGLLAHLEEVVAARPALAPTRPALPSLDRIREALLIEPAVAVRLAEERLASRPGDLECARLRAEALEQAGRSREAVDAWLQIAERVDGDGNWSALRHAAHLLQSLDDHAEAAVVLERMLRSPYDGRLRAEAKLRLARSLIKLGRSQEGRALLRELSAEEGRYADEASVLLKEL